MWKPSAAPRRHPKTKPLTFYLTCHLLETPQRRRRHIISTSERRLDIHEVCWAWRQPRERYASGVQKSERC